MYALPNYKPIEDYGVIGDLHTVALVGCDGSIDFMCFPEFDSPTIFGGLLDRRRGGHFMVAPLLDGARHKQLYLPDSNVLLTRFLSEQGVAEVSDFMPVEHAGVAHNIVRRAKTIRGELRFRMVCAPRFDYGRADHTVETRDGEAVFQSKGADGTALRLRSPVPLTAQDGAVVAEFTLGAGEHAAFVLETAEAGADSPSAGGDYVPDAFKATVNYWRQWIGRCNYTGRWREMVHRSALVLKLLTSQQYGSIVASPTFGLPEEIGGERNWDYRYTWIRDAAFTLYALMRLGFTEEAGAFFTWLEGRCASHAGAETLQLMYKLDGSRDLTEQTLPHLEGYMGSAPVRIGNDAYRQLQLDIYGELMDSVYLFDKYGEPIHHDLWMDLTHMIEWVCANWEQPDESIWEVRAGPRDYLYSRLLCWVAVDRAVRLSLKRSFPAPLDRWVRVRNEIYRDIYAHFWNPERGAFTESKDSDNLDAAVLMMPLMRFIGPTDPRWLSTLQAVGDELLHDSLVYRYRHEAGRGDGLRGTEGTFTLCTFWYVECLSRAGQIEQARLHLEKMLGYTNHLGLYAEELGPRGEHLGNYPQAFAHLALISAAFDLDRRLSAAGHRA